MAKLTRPTPIEEPNQEQPCAIHEPTHEEIEVRAYYRYLQHGCKDGCDLDDWLAAEAALRAEEESAAAA